MTMIPIDGEFIYSIAPKYSGNRAKAQQRIIDSISSLLAPTLDRYSINTFLRIAHFIAQVTHECAGFVTTEEFASGAAYEGREDLGNLQKGDGKKYKGRGLIQLTGRYNYRTYGKRLNLALEKNPELAGDPEVSLLIACAYWANKSLNDPADEDDIITITRKINGGLNGLEDRRNYLSKSKNSLARLMGLNISFDEGGSGVVLHRGSRGPDVEKLQRLLRSKGYDLVVDQDFGPATELAVKDIQRRHDILVDGIVGQRTWRVLE